MKRIGEIMKYLRLKVLGNTTDAPPGVGTSYLADLIKLFGIPDEFSLHNGAIPLLSPRISAFLML